MLLIVVVLSAPFKQAHLFLDSGFRFLEIGRRRGGVLESIKLVYCIDDFGHAVFGHLFSNLVGIESQNFLTLRGERIVAAVVGWDAIGL